MNRIWTTVIVCAIPSSLLGQCSLNGPDPRFPLDMVASVIGQKGFGGVAFTLRVSCPGEPNAHVRLKLDTNVGAFGLTVSPSEGITPLQVQVGVNPNRVAYFGPGSGVEILAFSTVDQSRPNPEDTNKAYHHHTRPTSDFVSCQRCFARAGNHARSGGIDSRIQFGSHDLARDR